MMTEDRAAEARHGGRYITHALAKTLQGWDSNPDLRARFAGEDGPEKLAEIWRYTASPSGGTYGTSGRDTTQAYARSQAANGGVEWSHSAYWLPQGLAESVFDWPIYRYGLAADMADAGCDVCGMESHGEHPPKLATGDDWLAARLATGQVDG